MECKDCCYLRKDVKVFGNMPEKVKKLYGDVQQPCNRYPVNSMRAPGEPACGELKNGSVGMDYYAKR